MRAATDIKSAEYAHATDVAVGNSLEKRRSTIPMLLALAALAATACGNPEVDSDPIVVEVDASTEADMGQQPDEGVVDPVGDTGARDTGTDSGCDAGCNAPSAEIAAGAYAIGELDFENPAAVLTKLPEITGGARIVSVGETIHFSDGYARARAVLIRSLVEEHGFRGVAFEGSWFDGLTVDAYVANGEGTLEDAVYSLTFGAWMNQPTADLLQWLRDWNVDNPDDRVRVFGIDVQDPIGPGTTLRDELAGAFTPQVDTLVADIDVCIGAEHDSWEEAYADPDFAGIFDGSLEYTDEEWTACRLAVDALEQWVSDNSAQLDTQVGERASVLIRVSLRTLRAWNAEIYFFDDYRRSYDARDAGIADVFDPLWNHFAGGAKTVIFAHNAHNRRRAPTLDAPATFKSYGSWLHERYGDEYAPIGFFAKTVEWNWPNEIGAGSWTATEPNSVELILSEFDESTVLVDLETATSPNGLFEPGATHPMGHASTGTGVPLDHYRALLYMDVSEPRP